MAQEENDKKKQGNLLFPIFLKQSIGEILLVGAGPVGLEKLQALVRNMPEASITVVAIDVLHEVKQLIAPHPNITLHQRPYSPNDLNGKKLVIAAVNNRCLSEQIRDHAHDRNLLINVADTPDLCDFYLGSIVKKGNLKLAISTNGRSPTAAKRIREMLEDVLPDELDEMLLKLNEIRNRLKGDFELKARTMNEITETLVNSEARTKQN
ncbi:MAG TPA: bifunctional precorrin-2 dehydrogenase/sirohydrochlorin ferrochelatase [Phnomibacter sp.]|nr:bifunctional precorrin-2 dehydrogenase/sirohydrochlorin ferrochelatase [Phnomibacter sp.]